MFYSDNPWPTEQRLKGTHATFLESNTTLDNHSVE